MKDPIEPAQAHPKVLPETVRRALALLQTSADRKLGLQKLAAYAGVSKYHLSRLFVRYLGHPPCRFQSEARLMRAAELLRTGQRVIEIALQLGYFDQAHFTREFTHRFGTSPCRYARARTKRQRARLAEWYRLDAQRELYAGRLSVTGFRSGKDSP